MKIGFENIKTGEVVTFETITDRVSRAAQIDAFVNSSNLGVNANKGQDFGWRLLAETQADFDDIKSDANQLNAIAQATGVMAENITDGQILAYMVGQEMRSEAAKAVKVENIAQFEDAYRRKVAQAKQRKTATVKEKPVVKPVKK
jgi:hypothetical protein